MAVTRTGVAFIAGATGYTGSALVPELVRSGVTAVAHVRPDSPARARREAVLAAAGALVDATPWDEDDMTAALAHHRPRAIFALLGTTRARGGLYETVDYGLSALLLRAARRAAPDALFVYLSSLGVSASARGAYLQVRWRFEQELRASGQPWIIARPSFITGPDREESRPLERYGAFAVDGLLRVVAAAGGRTLRDRYGSITASQLAAGLARAAFDEARAGRVLDSSDLR